MVLFYPWRIENLQDLQHFSLSPLLTQLIVHQLLEICEDNPKNPTCSIPPDTLAWLTGDLCNTTIIACIGIIGVARSGKSSIANALAHAIAAFPLQEGTGLENLHIGKLEKFLTSDAPQSCTMGLQVKLSFQNSPLSTLIPPSPLSPLFCGK